MADTGQQKDFRKLLQGLQRQQAPLTEMLLPNLFSMALGEPNPRQTAFESTPIPEQGKVPPAHPMDPRALMGALEFATAVPPIPGRIPISPHVWKALQASIPGIKSLPKGTLTPLWKPGAKPETPSWMPGTPIEGVKGAKTVELSAPLEGEIFPPGMFKSGPNVEDYNMLLAEIEAMQKSFAQPVKKTQAVPTKPAGSVMTQAEWDAYLGLAWKKPTKTPTNVPIKTQDDWSSTVYVDDITLNPEQGMPKLNQPKINTPDFIKGLEDLYNDQSHVRGRIEPTRSTVHAYDVPVGTEAWPGQTMIPQAAYEQGFTTPAYRGVAKPPRQHPQAEGYEMYSAGNPDLSNMYAMPFEGKMNEGAQNVPLLLDTSNFLKFDAQNSSWASVNSAAVRKAKKENKSGVEMQNVWDEPASTTDLGKSQTVFITLDPTKVRSKFAKFLPENVGKNDLMGSLLLGGLSLPFTGRGEQR